MKVLLFLDMIFFSYVLIHVVAQKYTRGVILLYGFIVAVHAATLVYN